MNNNPKDKLIVALDVPMVKEAKELIDTLSADVDIFKVGSEIFTIGGQEIIKYLGDKQKKIFLDLKFHDIPNTVGNAVASAATLNVFMMTIHTCGGEEMMKAAAQAVQKLGNNRPKIVGVTVLTSDKRTADTDKIILERAKLAKACGLDGVVASSQEAAMIRKELGKDFIIVTPGIRPSGADAGDQKRVTTPADAIKNGSSYLVVGRPIVKAENPKQAAVDICKEISSALLLP